jgi:acyl dehydratase
MGIKRELTGHTLPLTTFKVERGKIQKFAAATGDPNPIYSQRAAARAAGYEDSPAPPTFGTVMGFWALDKATQEAELGLPVAGMLHGEEEYSYLAPIYPGDVLSGVQRVASIVEKKSRTGSIRLITLETLYTNQAGQAVLQASTTIVVPERMDHERSGA